MLAIILAAVSFFGLLTPDVQQPSIWKEVSSSEGRFAVTLPENPTTNVLAVPSLRDGQLFTHMLSGTDNNLNSFMVAWTEYPAKKPDETRWTSRTIDRMRDAFAMSRDATVFQEAAVTIQNFPGRAVSLKTTEGKIIRVQFYFVNNRIYQITTETRASDVADGEKFLRSFKLLPGDLI